jgi:hypothetical protein
MSTNTTSTNDTNDTNDTIPPVIEAENKYKTTVQEQIDKEDELADKIQKMIKEKKEQAKSFANYTRDYFLDEEHSKRIQQFLNTALIAAIVLVIYGLYGSMMSYLFLALQQSNGLNGVDINEPPFRSNKVFNKCGGKPKTEDFGTMLQKSLLEYGFPYKNPISCDKLNAIKEPFLYIRFTRWLTTMIAYSYSSGRQFLNTYFGLFNSKTAFWIMPITNLIILTLSPVFGILSHGFGGVINAPELLPQLPFGAISMNPFSMFILFIVYIISIFTLPLFFGVLQTFVLLFFLMIYPFFQKEAFSFPEAQNTFMTGWTFISRYFQGKFNSLLFIWLMILIYNAYVNLEPFMAFFIIGLIGLHFFIVYFKNIVDMGASVLPMLFNKNNTILISLGFVGLIMWILTML